MNASKMLEKIASTLNAGESLIVNVAYARRWTLIEKYNLTKDNVSYAGKSWGGYGTLRTEYRNRVVNQSESGQSLVVVLILLALVIAVLVILGLVPNPLQFFTTARECNAVQAALGKCVKSLIQ